MEYLFLVQYHVTPKDHADFLVVKYQHELKRVKGTAYSTAVDTVGNSKRQLKQFGANSLELFERFNTLPDDYPIELSEGQKDSICMHCVTGKGEHCSEKYIEGDRKYLNKFLDISQKLNLADQISVGQQLATFIDGEPEQVRILRTQTSVVRAVLSKWELDLTF